LELNYRRKKRLGDLLIDAGRITEEDLKLALDEQKKNGRKLGETLIDLGFTTDLEIAKALHEQLKLDMVILAERIIASDILGLVNEELLRRYRMIPFEYKKNSLNVLRVAMADPLDMRASDIHIEAFVHIVRRHILLILKKSWSLELRMRENLQSMSQLDV